MVKELVKIGRQFNIFLKNKHNEPFFSSYDLLLFSTDPFICPQNRIYFYKKTPETHPKGKAIGYVVK